jgi:dihydroorotate dehydrogenase (NAD+) catalytic subunit
MFQKVKIMNASGVYSTKFSSLIDWIESGVDAIVTKTATFGKNGYENPTVAIDGENFLQAMGLPNPGYKEMKIIIEKIKNLYPNFPIICSLAPTNSEELTTMINYLQNYCDAFEINASCPHVAGHGSEIGFEPKILEEMTNNAKKNSKNPIGLKLPYYQTDETLKEIIDATKNADFYTNINSVGKAMMIGKDYGISNKLGGLSGESIRPLAVGQVYRTRKLIDKTIIGCGGIVDAMSAKELLLAGADAIQLGSGIRKYKTKKEFIDEIRKAFSQDFKPFNYFTNQNKEDWE